MSEKTVRTHSHASSRARAQPGADRKVIYKAVLDNPFRINWPIVPANVQNALLARVVAMTEGVSQYQLAREHHSRKRKTSRKRKNEADNAATTIPDGETMDIEPVDVELNPTGQNVPCSPGSTDKGKGKAEADSNAVRPSVMDHLTVGINEVTRLLEDVSKYSRETVVSDDSAGADQSRRSFSGLILVCRGDVDPPILISHLPYLVAACNSARPHLDSPNITPGRILLVPLSKGAEFSLAEAMGLRRVSVVAVNANIPEFTSLSSLLEAVPILRASWLTPQAHVKSLIPAHIKQLRTTAPKDMKAAKEQRTKEKAAAKERRKRLHEPVKKRIKISDVKPVSSGTYFYI